MLLYIEINAQIKDTVYLRELIHVFKYPKYIKMYLNIQNVYKCIMKKKRSFDFVCLPVRIIFTHHCALR